MSAPALATMLLGLPLLQPGQAPETYPEGVWIDFRTGEDARRMRDETGCAAVMIARGSHGDPWIFRQARAALDGAPIPPEPDVEERFRISESAYLSAFLEAGDAWEGWGNVGYKSLKRSAGVGVRLEMPLLGIIGLDIAYGFDDQGGRWRTHVQFGSLY